MNYKIDNKNTNLNTININSKYALNRNTLLKHTD